MVEWRRDAERVEGSDSVPGPQQDDASEGKLHHLEGEGREGVDQWRDQVVLKESEGEDDSESAPDMDSDDDDDDDDDDDSDLKTDGVSASNAIAFAAKKSIESGPRFGNIVVNSSSDVHFGNRTVITGPVTVKQFVYATRDGSVDGHRSEVDDDNGDTQVDAVEGLDRVQVDVVEGLDRVPGGLPNGKEQCLISPSGNFISAPSAHTLTSGPSPEVNGSLLPLWRPSTSEQKPHADTKGNAWQRVCTMVRTRRCIVMTTISACAVVLVVTLLLSLPPRDEATGTSERLPEDGNISPQFTYESTNNTASGKLRIVNRRTWLAQPAVKPSNGLHHPLPYVVILHTASETCFTQAACIFLVRHTQSFHIESNGWNDIGYSFLVGGDGVVYEGRGWDTEGAFAFGYNRKAIGIAFIGTFTSELPTPKQLYAGKQLIDLGVELGKISPAYKLLAHRQLSPTESPGLAFFELLKTWPHWAETP